MEKNIWEDVWDFISSTNGFPKQTEIAREFDLTPVEVNKIMKKLEEEKLIYKYRFGKYTKLKW